MAMNCPTCGAAMLDRLVYSDSIMVCTDQMLRAVHEQAAGAVHTDGGLVIPILPAFPKETKWARVKFCAACSLIVVAASDQIPREQIPACGR